MTDLDLATLCVHSGRRPTPDDPDLSPPLRRASTFLQHPGTHPATDAGRWDATLTEGPLLYARYGSPNVLDAEVRLARLEGAEDCALFASGIAAIHAALFVEAGAGGVVVAPRQLYGGTAAVLAHELAEVDVRAVPYDLTDPASLEVALAEARRERPEASLVVMAEGLSNPTARVAPLAELARTAHARGARLVVDSTFATPVVQRPLLHGADLVVHSATKALGGHSDLTAGAVLGARDDIARLRAYRRRTGAILDATPAWLLVRGLATLALRVRAQCEGALALADSLARHPSVSRVHYPGLATSTDHAVAAEMLEGGLFGSVLAFELRAGDAAARPLVSRLELACDAPSLGGVETLVSIPRVMSHAALDEDGLRAAGIGPGCIRVAVGIEHPADLVRDFERALDDVAG